MDDTAGSGRQPSARRLRSRAATVQEIKETARAVLAEEGAGALTLSAVARRLQVVPSALYRYTANREELLGALSADAYDDLADTLELAVASAPAGADAVERLRIAARSWRSWALARPTEFALVFGPPIPGYAPGTQALAAADRTGAVFAALIVEALQQRPAGAVAVEESLVPPGLRPVLASVGPDAASGSLFVSGWIRLQGHLCAEVFENLPPVPAELRGDLFDLTVDLLLREAGLLGSDVAAGR